jgi:hypothetical protein
MTGIVIPSECEESFPSRVFHSLETKDQSSAFSLVAALPRWASVVIQKFIHHGIGGVSPTIQI